MKVHVEKFADGLAIRIPKPLAAQLGLVNHSPVELSLHGENLIITPLERSGPKLSDLLAGVTPDTRHDAIDTSAAVGKEAW